MEFWTNLDKTSIVLSLVIPSVSGVAFFARCIKDRYQQKKHRDLLNKTALSDAVAICLRAGGRSDPTEDVKTYLKKSQCNIQHLIVLNFPEKANFSSQDVAHQIIEDIREQLVINLGNRKLSEVHFFPSGMIAYPFVVGAMLSNWCPVIVYHLESGTYIPLYRVSKELLQEKKRSTRPIIKVDVFSLKKIAEHCP